MRASEDVGVWGVGPGACVRPFGGQSATGKQVGNDHEYTRIHVSTDAYTIELFPQLEKPGNFKPNAQKTAANYRLKKS